MDNMQREPRRRKFLPVNVKKAKYTWFTNYEHSLEIMQLSIFT